MQSVDAREQALHALVHDFAHDLTKRLHAITHIHHRTVSRCTRARLHAPVHDFTHDFKLGTRVLYSSSI